MHRLPRLRQEKDVTHHTWNPEEGDYRRILGRSQFKREIGVPFGALSHFRNFRFRRRGDYAILQIASVRHLPSRGGKLRGSGALAASFGANDIAFGTDPERQRPLNRDIRKYALAKEKKGIGRELGRVVS